MTTYDIKRLATIAQEFGAIATSAAALAVIAQEVSGRAVVGIGLVQGILDDEVARVRKALESFREPPEAPPA